MTVKIVMEFEDRELARAFFGYMADGGGEQNCEPPDADYYMAFDYWCGADEFLGNNTVKVTRSLKDEE